jgi:hypothetical protein
MAVRRTEIDVDGPLATIGRSVPVTATSEQDSAPTPAAAISRGDLIMGRDGIVAPF